MCEFRFGEYCFNPKYLEPGVIARHWTEVPCCSEKKELKRDEFWEPAEKPARAFLFF